MDERKKIEDKLRKKEAEISGLEDRLRTARIYVQALQDVLRLLEPGDEQPSTALRPGSAVAQAREVIVREGRPLHIGAILEALGKGVNRETRASLTSSLAAYVRRGEIFTRPAPNTFGLAELGHQTMAEDDGPPVGFGKGMPEGSLPDEPANSEREDIPF